MRVRVVKSSVLGILIGAAIGIGAYTFVYARGASYLTDNPAACANCHIMQEQYSGWQNSSHRAVATCNDCHTPPGFFGKYTTKATNGFWHSFAFTTGYFHEPIQIGARNLTVTERACQKCHQDITTALIAPHGSAAGEQPSCVRCHRSVGHLH